MLGYGDSSYEFHDDMNEIGFPVFFIFGFGIVNVLLLVPMTLAILPIACYWLLYNIWRNLYLTYIK